MTPDEFHELRDFLSIEFGKVRSQFGDLRTEVDGLRTEVGELRSEVGGLRSEVDGLRTEVGELRSEVGGLRSELADFEHHVTQHFARVDRKLDALDLGLTLERTSREEMQAELRLVAEGVVTVDGKIETFRAETREEFTGVRDEMRVGFDSVNDRLTSLEAA